MLKKPIVLTAMLLSVTSVTGCKPSDLTIVTSDYKIVVRLGEDIDYSFAHQVNEAVNYSIHRKLPIVLGTEPSSSHEIIFDMSRIEAQELRKSLDDDEYAIKEENGKIIVAASSHMSRMCAVDRLLTEYYDNGIKIPKGTLVKGKCKSDDVVTEITLPEDASGTYQEIRDPFIVKDNDTYYLYGTTFWDGIDWRVYKASSLKAPPEEWEKIIVVNEGDYHDIKHQRWAPEVHKYGENYYMFTTYNRVTEDEHRSGKPDNRGVTILKSKTPEGPFEIISHNDKNDPKLGHITDDSKECTIDGTLYVDPNGQPWLVYVNEWVSQPDGIGRFSAVKFSEDLTTIDESTNQELFRADAAPWGIGDGVTDGCFIHRMESGRLIMTWSKGNGHGYSVGYATSDNGILGPWEQHDQLLFAAGMYKSDSVEGGHGMIFEDNGQLFMCLHGPNGNTEHPIVFPVKETKYNTIAWDIYNYINKK